MYSHKKNISFRKNSQMFIMIIDEYNIIIVDIPSNLNFASIKSGSITSLPQVTVDSNSYEFFKAFTVANGRFFAIM